MTDVTAPAGAAAPAPEKTVADVPQDTPAPADPLAESATSDNPDPDPSETAAPAPTDKAAAPDAEKAKDTAASEPVKTPPAEKRIAKLTAKLREAERERDALKAAKTGDAPADVADKAPTPDQFKTWEEYETARVAHLVQKTTREQETKREQDAAKQQWAETRDAFLAGVPKAAETYPDFEEVVMDRDGVFDTTPQGEALASLVMLADKSHDVAYHLASNPKEAERIKALPPIKAALAIGRLSATIAQPATRTVPKAPDPPPTVKGGDAPQKDPAKMSMAEYEAWRKGGGRRA